LNEALIFLHMPFWDIQTSKSLTVKYFTASGRFRQLFRYLKVLL